jgi:hypothetical protein
VNLHNNLWNTNYPLCDITRMSTARLVNWVVPKLMVSFVFAVAGIIRTLTSGYVPLHWNAATATRYFG